MHTVSLRALPATATAPLRTRLSSRARAAPRSVTTMAGFYDLSVKARHSAALAWRARRSAGGKQSAALVGSSARVGLTHVPPRRRLLRAAELARVWLTCFVLQDINGKEVKFADKFAGKVVLMTNVASACGYTRSNYSELVALHDKYAAQGLEIVAFPCNQVRRVLGSVAD